MLGLRLQMFSRGFPMRSFKRWLSGALLAAASHSVVAEERLFTGQVQSITLQPSGVGQCSQPCPPPAEPPRRNELQRVCISNMGGCQKAVVKILVDHLGTEQGKELEFPSRTGEWGELNFPVTDDPILVYAFNGRATWTHIVERAGQVYVNPQVLGRRGKIPHLEELQKNQDGNVLLSDLLAKFGARR
jgi:hypothetical protein